MTELFKAVRYQTFTLAKSATVYLPDFGGDMNSFHLAMNTIEQVSVEEDVEALGVCQIVV